MFCSKCGKEIPADAKLCPYCGNKVSPQMETKAKEKIHYVSSKSRMLAGGLCLFGLIGLAGMHRMYVGKWKTGMLYAVTFGIFFFGTAYDAYQIYYESFRDTDGFPLYAPESIKKNHKKRVPKGETNVIVKILAILFLLSAFGNMMAGLMYHPQKSQNQASTQKEQSNQSSNTDSKKEKRKSSDKKQESELELVEKIKDGYQNNNFLDANSALSRLKNLYPDSQYISAIEKDYPDLTAKVEAEKEEKARQRRESLDAFNSEMSNGPGASIYEGYEFQQGGIKFCVYANSNWHSLSEGQKKTFTEIAYATFSKYGINAPKFYIVNVNNNRNLAHFPGVFGGVALDD